MGNLPKISDELKRLFGYAMSNGIETIGAMDEWLHTVPQAKVEEVAQCPGEQVWEEFGDLTARVCLEQELRDWL